MPNIYVDIKISCGGSCVRNILKLYVNVTNQMTLNESDILIIEGNNRENWKLGIIKNLMREKDGIVGVAKPRTGKFYLE